MLGPAFVASIAYVDPGNFATNIRGRRALRLSAAVGRAGRQPDGDAVQYLSAKLGIVTEHNLPELFREHYPRPLSWGMWVQAEIMAMSTDVAEFLGAALGLNLLFGVPLLPAGLITGVIAFAILGAAVARVSPLRAGDHGAAGDHLRWASSTRRCASARPRASRCSGLVPALARQRQRCTWRSGSSARP